MTYTFIGDKDFILKELDNMLQEFSIENTSRYDMEQASIDVIINDLNTVSLFGKKIIIVENIDKLNDTEVLEKYLNNESSNILVLISYKELDKRKKLTKLLKERTTVKEFLNNNIEEEVLKKLEDFSMNKVAVNTLISYCSNDINRVLNELEKLKLFKSSSKEITLEDVEKLVKKGFDATIFDLIDAINIMDINKVFKVYDDLLMEQVTDEQILYTIANHYRFLYQIKIKSKDKTDDEIIKEYKMHPYRLVKLKEQLSLISDEKILFIIKKLSDMDIDIKSGNGDIKNLMYLFFNSIS